MTYIKSLLVGFVAAVVAMIVYFLAEVAFVVFTETGSGGIGAVSVVSYGPFVGIAAFLLGFYFMFRRLKLRRSENTQALHKRSREN